jgi:cytochrome c peroxidase
VKLLALLLAVAAASSPAQVLDFTPQERAQIVSLGPWPPAPAADASNRVQGPRRSAAVAWGRQLFSDPWLSRDGALSCASCHRSALAFQDGAATAGGRRERGIRNTPSLLDVAGQRWFGWGGANDSLWAASLAPLLAEGEMGHDVASLAARVRSLPAMVAAYRGAFGTPLPADDERVAVDIAKALAAYQATLVSPRTPFDEFREALVRGDVKAAARYPVEAQRGLRLFIGHGRCSVCHAGPRFTNGEFADIGVPFFVAGGGVDPGRHAGLQALQASRYNRLGGFNDAGAAADPQAVTSRHVVLEHRHFGEFRVPGLRQLVHTAPYMHNGSLASIEAVVRHYSELDENRLHADGERILRPLKLTEPQAADLAAFLRSLSTDFKR